jgi:hypothetical protein
MSDSREIAIAPVTFGELREMAETMAASGMFGKNPAQMMSLMLIAQAENLHPALAAMEYDVIQGRPALKGQAALARFQQSGGSVEWKVKSDAEARAVFSHPRGGSLEVSWTMERAKKMGLDQKDNWRKQPGVMLSWRCVAEGVRAVYPACLNRMYLSEEAQDFEPMRNVTPESKPAPRSIETSTSAESKKDNSSVDTSKKLAPCAAQIKAAENAKNLAAAGKPDIDKETKSRLWSESGKKDAVYWKLVCIEQENLLASPIQNEQEPDNTGDLFGDPVQEIIVELEGWIESDSAPPAMREEIRSTIESGENDVRKLRALLDKVIAAAGQ